MSKSKSKAKKEERHLKIIRMECQVEGTDSNPAKVVLAIDELPPTYNQYLRTHFRNRGAVNAYWHDLIQRCLNGRRPQFKGHKVKVTMISFRSRLLDLDGLYSSIKVPLDALVYNKVLDNDDPAHVADLHCEQKVVKRSDVGITIIIELI